MQDKYNTCSYIDPIEPINLACRDIPGADRLWESIWEDLRRKQEEIIKQVLRELLKREPDTEDFKNCTLGFYQGESKYLFAFEGVSLGTIEVKLFPEGSITFTPHIHAGNI